MVGRHVLVEIGCRLGSDERPEVIAGHDGLRWVVEDVIERWQHPQARRYGKVPGDYGALAQWWALTVTGPLPGREGGSGVQQVTICSYGTGAGWWMFTGDPGQAPRYQPARSPG